VDINQPAHTSSKLTDVVPPQLKKRQIDDQPADTSSKLTDEVPPHLKKRRVPKINVFLNNTKLLLPVNTFSPAIINTTGLCQLNVGFYYLLTNFF
jgi:hypothetical protein